MDGAVQHHARRVHGQRRLLDRRLAETDRARSLYLRRFYDRDSRDPALYHLMLDSTVVPLAVCTDLIATAAGAARAGGYVVGCAP
jgi:hypothetical protein